MFFRRSLGRSLGVLLCAAVVLPRCSFGETVKIDRLEELALQLEQAQAELDDARLRLSDLQAERHTAGPIAPIEQPHGIGGQSTYQSADDLECVSFCQPPKCNCPKCRAQQKVQVTPFGAIYGEMIHSENTISLRGSPLFLVPGPAAGIDDSRFTVSGQQSLVGLKIAGPDMGSFTSGGVVAANFFGEQPVANNPGLFFLLANAELRNDRWRFWIGQDADGIGRQNTNSPSWVSHKMQGNFGQIRPGFRVERYFPCSETIDSSLYFGVTQQAVNDFIAMPGIAGIDNGWPNVEMRWESTFGAKAEAGRPVLFAIGGLIGETRAVDDLAMSGINVSTSWAVIPEVRIEGERLGFQGEAFIGQAMGTYNGAIGQSLNPMDGEAIYSAGGFGELFWKATPYFTASIGYGIDNPRDRDLGLVTPMIGQRSRNESYWLNFIWKISDEWESRFEVSHLATDYVAPSNNSDAMICHFLLRYMF